MRNANLLLVVAAGRTGKVLNPRTTAMYTVIPKNDTEMFASNDTRIVGPVYYNPTTKKHVVKSASGFSNLEEWLS